MQPPRRRVPRVELVGLRWIDVTAPGGVDDAEPETMPVALPKFGNWATTPSVA